MLQIFKYLRWRLSVKKRAKESVVKKTQKYETIKNADQQGYDICLLGDSLIEYWKIETLDNKKCFNAGVGDATSEDVLHQLQNKLLTTSFHTFIIILGTNDIKYGISSNITVNNLLQIINIIAEHNPSHEIIYLTIPSVNGRWDRKNSTIKERNKAILYALPNEAKILPVDFLNDENDNLKTDYTIDGLHFTEKAYKQIEYELKSILSNE